MPSEPILPLCICGNPLCKIPYGYCHCGCGIKTKIPRYSHKGDGRVAGMPMRFVRGHSGVQPRPPIRYGKIDGELVAYIPLTKGYWAIVDRYNLHLVLGRVWFYAEGYAACSLGHDCGLMQMHNVIMPPPKGNITDHKFGKTLDNRVSQLRYATSTQNHRNVGLSAANTSGYKGVSWDGAWRVAIKVDGILIHLGSFPKDRLVEAAKAYDAGAIKYHGEFARLNFPQVSE